MNMSRSAFLYFIFCLLACVLGAAVQEDVTVQQHFERSDSRLAKALLIASPRIVGQVLLNNPGTLALLPDTSSPASQQQVTSLRAAGYGEAFDVLSLPFEVSGGY